PPPGASPPSGTPLSRSGPSSTAGTTAANPSSGPRPPSRSCRKPTVKQLQLRSTSTPSARQVAHGVPGDYGTLLFHFPAGVTAYAELVSKPGLTAIVTLD